MTLKIHEKSIRKCHPRWKASILLHFARKSSLRRPQDGPRRPKRRQDTPQSPPRHLRDAPRRSQDASQDAPGTPVKLPFSNQNALIASKIDFYGFLIDFWSFFDGCFLLFSHVFGQARWRVRSSAARWICQPSICTGLTYNPAHIYGYHIYNNLCHRFRWPERQRVSENL